jgi:ATP-dependent exoDNAse (exonuclease V) beta subunit
MVVRWVTARPPARIEPETTPVHAHEPALRALEPVPWRAPADHQAEEALARAAARPPIPLPGLLAHAAGKIWATGLKSERDRDRLAPPPRETEERATPDEPAEPLFTPEEPAQPPRTPEEAAAEGIVLHSLLERLDMRGLTHENLETRLAEAAARTAGMTGDLAELARAALARLLTLPLGRALATGTDLHREVAFSLRVPLLELTRWAPPLREEMLASPDWVRWIEISPDGALSMRADRAGSVGEPWVLVQGRVDAILRDGDTWWVLDWKSDRVAGDADLAAAATRYGGQLAIYRRAVERLFGSPVRAALYFLRPGILREVETS